MTEITSFPQDLGLMCAFVVVFVIVIIYYVCS